MAIRYKKFAELKRDIQGDKPVCVYFSGLSNDDPPKKILCEVSYDAMQNLIVFKNTDSSMIQIVVSRAIFTSDDDLVYNIVDVDSQVRMSCCHTFPGDFLRSDSRTDSDPHDAGCKVENDLRDDIFRQIFG